MSTKELEEQLDKLSEPEKKQLLRRLIADLDTGKAEDVKRLWLEEVQHRYQELQDGVVSGICAEVAIKKARERLRNAF